MLNKGKKGARSISNFEKHSNEPGTETLAPRVKSINIKYDKILLNIIYDKILGWISCDIIITK